MNLQRAAAAPLGEKYQCSKCGARFYDLNRSPVICPKCGTAGDRPVTAVAAPTRGRSSRRNRRSKSDVYDARTIDDDDGPVGLDDAPIEDDDAVVDLPEE